jgi:hypothetical protein
MSTTMRFHSPAAFVVVSALATILSTEAWAPPSSFSTTKTTTTTKTTSVPSRPCHSTSVLQATDDDDETLESWPDMLHRPNGKTATAVYEEKDPVILTDIAPPEHELEEMDPRREMDESFMREAIQLAREK